MAQNILQNTDNVSMEARELALSICPLSADIKDPFWIKNAQNMLTGFIVYYFNQGFSIWETMKEIKSKPLQEIISTILQDQDDKAKIEIIQFHEMNEATLAGIFTELTNHITDKNLKKALM